MKLQLALQLVSFYLCTQVASTNPKGTTYTSKFDELGFAPAALNEIGKYDGLVFETINFATPGVGGAVINGILPESPSNIGTYSARIILMAGGKVPTIRADTSAKVESFDLNSFFYGCTLATIAGPAGATFSCTVTVKGYRKGNKVAEQPFDFVGSLVGAVPLRQAKLNKDFVKLDSVTFSSRYPVDLLGATVIDSVVHTNYGPA